MATSMEKYNLEEALLTADKQMTDMYESTGKTNMHQLLGRAMLTFPQYINSMRSIMFSSHESQLLNPVNPDFPGFFTGAENTVGRHSDGYKMIGGKSKVIKKIEKFADIVDNPQIYQLFIYDEERQRYDVFERRPGESLVETYGFEYNTDTMDSLKEGDTIVPGTPLIKSRSYDDDMNYSYGRDVDVMYTLNPFTSEDAAEVSDEVANATLVAKFDDVYAGLNDNDYPINIYGDDTEYKVFPDVGEATNGIAIAIRRKFNNQVFHDFKKDMMSKITDTDFKFFLEGTVCDITIFCNNEDLPKNSFTKQIWRYYKSQTKYYREIRNTCEEIIASGKDFSQKIDDLYSWSKKMLNKKYRWKYKDSVFSNLLIHIETTRRDGLSLGQKISFRMGNKSVVAKVVPKEQMPYYYNADGEKVHAQVKINMLGVINRTTAAPLFEMCTNFIGRKCQEKMRTLSSREEKVGLLFDVLEKFNPAESGYMKERYYSKSEEEKDAFVDYCENVKIHFNQPPIEEPGMTPIFYRLGSILDTYDWIQLEPTYVYRWGREIRCLQDGLIAKMYMIVLKQTSKRGYSARNMGSVNQKGFPARSNKSKTHLDKESSTAIRFGESENLTFMVGMSPEEDALINAYYRSSQGAMSDLGKAILRNKSVVDVPKEYTSGVAQYFHVQLRALGIGLDFYDSDNDLKELDDNALEIFDDGSGGQIICTAYEKFLMDRRAEVATEILNKYGLMDIDELNEKINKIIEERHYLIGDVDLDKPFFTNCVEIERILSEAESQDEEAHKEYISTIEGSVDVADQADSNA